MASSVCHIRGKRLVGALKREKEGLQGAMNGRQTLNHQTRDKIPCARVGWKRKNQIAMNKYSNEYMSTKNGILAVNRAFF